MKRTPRSSFPQTAISAEFSKTSEPASHLRSRPRLNGSGPEEFERLITKIWTIGHSTRSIEDFLAALEARDIKLIGDVRLMPGSKRYPHFNNENLIASLQEREVRYEHFPELGGRRRAKPDSRNTAWRNAAFRGYADHMETEEFRAGIQRLVDAAALFGPTAIMCAEAVWWRCHRSLISDYLKVRGVEVAHIMTEKKIESHPYTSAARIVNGELSYAAQG